MKMNKKGYNWRARSAPKVEIDNSGAKKIVIDIEHQPEKYDNCNALVLPEEKRKTIYKNKKGPKTALLSKKRRKLLEKVVDKKEKKLRRVTLLEDLKKVQAPLDELNQYISLTSIQTKGIKRHIRESKLPEIKVREIEDTSNDENEEVIDAIRGNKKRRLALLNQSEKDVKAPSNPNIVGLEESSESDSELSEDSNEIENEKEINSPQSVTEEKIEEDVIIPESKIIDIPKTITNLPTSNNSKVPKRMEKRVPAVFVPLNRKPEIQQARLKLPILAEEQKIVETINENSVIVVTGETGSGKTTQIPQFLYEAGYARTKMIGVTEPRRVAAMSMSKRVGEEMNLTTEEVSYLIRFEGNVTPKTKIKFMTDGVLLKEIQNDFLLSKYSVIILDEAHERSVYTDILIGLLSRIVPQRAKRNDPLKMIIMSATLRVQDFIENERLFKSPPLVTVESRQFPVTIHFNRKTNPDYVTEALKKIVKIHTSLPEGGILVFLTGQHEVNSVVSKLRKKFPFRKKPWTKSMDSEKTDEKKDEVEIKEPENDDWDEEMNSKRLLNRLKKKNMDIELPKISLDDYSVNPTDDTQADLFDIDDYSDEELDDDEWYTDSKTPATSQPLWVLPLYSLLPAQQQAEVFKAIPEGCRLCVVSTNVAETSLTIPNVRYVVDSGRCKTRLYDKVTGVSTFKVTYSSQAAANQRAGRAGRTGPGHCYRLYSSAIFNDQFEKFSEPEIRRKPVDDLILQMKVMNILKVTNFPFPSAPDTIQLQSAEKRLRILGALVQPPFNQQDKYNTSVTPLGQSIAAFPVAPRYGKMLALSQQHNLIGFTICMVSALSVQELLIEGLGSNEQTKVEWKQKRRFWAGTGNCLLLGDLMVLIGAVGEAEYKQSKGRIVSFCEKFGLRPKAITEIRKLRIQLTNEISLNIPNLGLSVDPKMSPPTDTEARLLRQIVLAGMVDQVAKKLSPDEIKQYRDKATGKKKFDHAYKTLEMEDPVFMHYSSVLRKKLPEWVVYQEVYETNKVYMRGVTAIEPEWLPKFAPTLCRMNEPLNEPPPRYDSDSGKIFCHMGGTFGRGGWELPTMELEYPETVDGVKWFARFFLEGEVFPKLKKFVPNLRSTPANISKSWARSISRVENMIKTLMSKGVMSKDRLLEVWEDDKKFLLNAYKEWLPESAHEKVARIWPPM